MSIQPYFLLLEEDDSVFKFSVDTSKINSGATNGSQNPLTFKIPMLFNAGNVTSCILRVSDGRADVNISNTEADINTKSLITFASSGIYTITLIGRVAFFQASNSTVGYDFRKLIFIDNWGSLVRYQSACFDGCINLTIRALDSLKLPSVSTAFFRNIAGFSHGRLDNIIMTDVTVLTSILAGVPTVFMSLFNSFMPALVSANQVYAGLDVSNVTKAEIISNSVTDCNNIFSTPQRNFNGELILQTPNNTNIQALCYYFNTMPSLAKVDIRRVTSALNFLRNAMSLARTNATLIGWASNFDWSGVPTVANKVTLDFKASTYNSTASSAKLFLESKGIVFTNLNLV